MCIGICGLILGVGLYVAHIFVENARLRILGVAYVLLSLAIFGIREVMARVEDIRKQKIIRRRT